MFPIDTTERRSIYKVIFNICMHLHDLSQQKLAFNNDGNTVVKEEEGIYFAMSSVVGCFKGMTAFDPKLSLNKIFSHIFLD